MIDFKAIPTADIARELGLRKSKNGNWHCFNTRSHNNGDKKASLSISEDSKGFNCFGCGIQGNNVELVKLAFQVDAETAMNWLKQRFGNHCDIPEKKKNPASNTPPKKTAKLQIRFINGQLSGDERFRFFPETDLILKDPQEKDLENIKRELGKSFSIETLLKVKIKINHSKVGYGLVFSQGQLVFNPKDCNQYLHLEGRTDYLTAIELGLDGHFGIVSNYNKTAKVELTGGSHYYIMDKDVSEEQLKDRIQALSFVKVKFIRLPGEFGDLSDFYNRGNCSREKILEMIEKTPVENLSPPKTETISPEPKHFKVYSGRDLLTQQFPDPNWAIKGLLLEGLTILAGRPKSGKSWMGLDWCLSVCQGGNAMGKFSTEKGEALYIGFEDPPRRLQSRLKMMLGIEPQFSFLDGFYFMNEFQRLEEGGEEQLRKFLEEKPDLRLVVIDTYARFTSRKSNTDLYTEDYAIGARLQKIALDYRIALVIIHHTRKIKSDNPLDDVSGTTGTTAAADAVFVLKKSLYGTELHVTGRDIDEQALAIQFDKTTGLWKVLGSAEEVSISEQRKTIIDAISQSDSPLSPKEVADVTGKRHNNIKQLMHTMKKDGLLESTGDGKYVIPDNRNNLAL